MKAGPILSLTWFHVLISFSVASADWKEEARAYVKEQGVPIIEERAGTRSADRLALDRWAWAKRVLWPVFERHAQKWPAQAERMHGFLQQVIMASINHPGVDRSRPPGQLEQEGLGLEKNGVDEPMVLYATAWAAWESREGYGDATRRLQRAAGHKALKDYPAAAALMIRQLQFEIEEARHNEGDDHHEAFFNAARAALLDESSYSMSEEELLWLDVRRMYYMGNLDSHRTELESLMREERFSPWLRAMMQGMFYHSSAWKARGTGFVDTVKSDGIREFERLMPEAALRFREAWRLHPARPEAAAQMVNLLRAGFEEDGETITQWFERSVAAQFDFTEPIFDLVWAVRPRWGGSVEKIKAVLLSAALTDRPDTPLADTVRKVLAFIREDSGAENDNEVLQKDPLLRSAVMHTLNRLANEPSRAWERPWRIADQAVYAWMAGLYEQADSLLAEVATPFPRQTRRKITKGHNERSVRGEAALFSQNLGAEWSKAREEYLRGDVLTALKRAQQIAGQFPVDVPELVLEMIAACDFELRFSRGGWISLDSTPELAAWHRLSGDWIGMKDGGLGIQGQDAQGVILLAGRVGQDFEMRGEYTIEAGNPFQGLEVIAGHHRRDGRERLLACAQWQKDGESSSVSLLRDFAMTQAPVTTLRGAERTWRFHLFSKGGRITYRLNHHDVLLGHLDKNRRGEVFTMPTDGRVGFRGHYFAIGSSTHVRGIEIRRVGDEEKAPTSDIAGLHAMMAVEIEDRIAEARREGKDSEADRIREFGRSIATAGGSPVELPECTLGDVHFHALLRGYSQSVSTRKQEGMRPLDTEWPLTAPAMPRWQRARGEWTLADGVLTGSGDSIMNLDLGLAPPFQVDFDLTALEGMRPRVVMGRVKFANEGAKNTFGLYPQIKGQPLFAYQKGHQYHITLKALSQHTELEVDGRKVCDGPKIEGVLELLQFRAGDDYSKGKAEFRNLRITKPQ